MRFKLSGFGMWQTLSAEHKSGATVVISASLLETWYYLAFTVC